MSTLNITPPGQAPTGKPVYRRRQAAGIILVLLSVIVVSPTLAIDLEKFTGVTGPLLSALTQLSALAPGLKGIIGFISFCVAFISLAALRNLGPVLFFVGVMIFGAVGLVVGGAIMGAVI